MRAQSVIEAFVAMAKDLSDLTGGQEREQGAPPSESSPRSIRILVAEDSPTNQAVIRALLKKLGHPADIVANGLEAVAAVRERPYDLVLMDVMMPEMDGIAAPRAIRTLPGSAGRVPVFALTAEVSADHHAIFREAGMQAVLIKPIALSALQAALAPAPSGPVQAAADLPS